MRYVTATLCIYEGLALLVNRLPTLTSIVHQWPWKVRASLIGVIVAWLILHFQDPAT